MPQDLFSTLSTCSQLHLFKHLFKESEGNGIEEVKSSFKQKKDYCFS